MYLGRVHINPADNPTVALQIYGTHKNCVVFIAWVGGPTN